MVTLASDGYVVRNEKQNVNIDVVDLAYVVGSGNVDEDSIL